MAKWRYTTYNAQLAIASRKVGNLIVEVHTNDSPIRVCRSGEDVGDHCPDKILVTGQVSDRDGRSIVRVDGDVNIRRCEGVCVSLHHAPGVSGRQASVGGT